jgi:hypothetical protein
MPPHCDTLDGPVVTAAREALDADDVDLALPFVPADGDQEVIDAFELARKARVHGPEAREVADLYFFDTVVRVHRRGDRGRRTAGRAPAADGGSRDAAATRARPGSETRDRRRRAGRPRLHLGVAGLPGVVQQAPAPMPTRRCKSTRAAC